MPYTLRPKAQLQKPNALLIGSSTGGLQAVSKVFSDLKDCRFDLPILITQHLPENFDSIFAKKLSDVSGLKSKVAEENDIVEPGTIYVAPGNFHMAVTKSIGGEIRISIIDSPSINFCKPSVDVLFSSAAKIWKANLFAVILTGIGNDGLEGATEIANNGGGVIAQNEETSIVWGMPGAVVKAGICNDILSIDKIAEFLKSYSFGKIR